MKHVSRRVMSAGLAGATMAACSPATLVPIGPSHEGADRAERQGRKARSEAILRAENVPLLASLPVVDSVADTHFRTVQEATDRAFCLAYVAVLAETEDRSLLNNFFGAWDAPGHMTPDERAFVATTSHTDIDRSKFSWRYESFATLAWALGHLDALGRPDHQVDVAAMMGHVGDLGLEGFRSRARMRSGAEIVDLLDITYRYDWAAVDARTKHLPTPAGLIEDVIVERHTALNWLTNYLGQDWDDVTTDT